MAPGRFVVRSLGRPYTFAVLRAARGPISFAVFATAVVVAWETVKLLGGETTDVWRPPFHWKVASDLNMPHIWEIASAFVAAPGPALPDGALEPPAHTARAAVAARLREPHSVAPGQPRSRTRS